MGTATSPNWVREPVGRQRQEDVSVLMIDSLSVKWIPVDWRGSSAVKSVHCPCIGHDIGHE